MTDEELKQQYGIHLATRLQSDDPNKQANWADIDDDDDDWAPETIEWTDGTKITLPSVDEIAASASKPATPPIVSTVAMESPKPRSPAPGASAPSTLKLTAGSSGSGRGLVLKGAPEKPTLVAKPPGPPAPIKSPWAPLPPVDKAVPIAVELQQQTQPFSRGPREPHGFDQQPPAAKEIAADDFSRTWRDGPHAHANRELFNSQSGRFEPLQDNRKGSRGEGGGRLPAVLQRPHQSDQSGPAEPSAAFQTHRASGPDGIYGRRRASSNLSGGSGALARRMSKGQDMQTPHDLYDTRRGSFVGMTDSPASPNMSMAGMHQAGPRGHGHGQHGQQPSWQARPSPSMSHASPASAAGQMAVPGNAPPAAQAPQAPQALPIEDELELQKKIMQERRELARKRRLEEEAREDAERKERIRLKLEAMGPPPEPKKAKKETTSTTTKDDKPTAPQIQARDASSDSVTAPKQPQLRVPEADGDVKQYGMMKVHPPEPLTTTTTTTTADSKAQRVDEIHLSISKRDSRAPGMSTSAPTEVVEQQHAPLDSRQSQQWQKGPVAGSERYASWANPGAHSAQGRNVWGPPTNDRTLGNGTFNPELLRLPDTQAPQSQQMAASGPGPIGPPAHSRANNAQYQGRTREQYAHRPAPIGPPQRQQDIPEQQQRANAAAAWNSLPEKLAREEREERDKQDLGNLERQPGVVSPQSHVIYKDTWKQVTVEDGVRNITNASQIVNDALTPTAPSGWNEYAARIAQDDAAERARQENAWRAKEMGAVGMPPTVYKDTWRQVQVENGMRSDIMSSTTTLNTGASPIGPPTRGSRFFPQSKDVRLEESLDSLLARPGSPSPPPPTMAGHPAYDGDIDHPQVSLPRPPPVVRLPPPRVLAPIGPPPKPITSFAAAAAAPVVPSATTTSYYSKANEKYDGKGAIAPAGPQRATQGAGAAGWQDRINHLIGRKSSPPKPAALAVDSSSKHALELPVVRMSATVSLPGSPSTLLPGEETPFETKPVAEECFEEQEMGSLPTIRIPHKAPDAAWNPAGPPAKPLHRKYPHLQITTVEPLSFLSHTSKEGYVLRIYLPGMKDEKQVNIPIKRDGRQGSNSRHGKSRGGPSRHTSSAHPRGGAARDSGFPAHGEQTTPSASTGPSTRPAGRGRGGRGAQWINSRHASSSNTAINA
jgi:hypothetical protein